MINRARICQLFMSPICVAWLAVVTNRVVVPTRQATWAGGIDSYASQKFTNTGSGMHLESSRTLKAMKELSMKE
jgi:hypothetical protein